ncbi:MAG: hypothetical protein IJT24_01280, partial [Lachnospiraceae bacterium]|nr:hypothetical protein [Lachnospiraceae bacterium]
VKAVTLSDGTVLGKDDFYVIYGSNIAARKNGGSFKVILKRNDKAKTFKYGGIATFKFTITNAEGITL